MEKFQKLLDENHEWPDEYVFKFIIPKAEIEKLSQIIEDDFTSRPSRTGKYISITYVKMMDNSSEVIKIYEKLKAIKNIVMI